MNYTASTTVEQYKAWLDTNPSMQEFATVTKQVFAQTYSSIDNMLTNINSLENGTK